MKNKILPKTILVFFALMISLVMAELLVRKIKPQITYSEANRLVNKCYANDPLLPFSLMKNAKCNLINPFGDFNTFATINSLGYRGKNFSLNKEQGVKRILALGDSFVFGFGVSDEETFPYQLEEILEKKLNKKVEVINAGYADAFSPDSYYVYLKNRGLKLKPDLIIMEFFVWNDIGDFTETVWEEVDEKGLPSKISSCCRVADQGILRNKITEIKYRYPWLRESHLFLAFMGVLKSRLGLPKEPKNAVPKRDFYQGCVLHPGCIDNFKSEEEKTYTVIKGIKELTKTNKIPLIVILVPVDIQLYPEAWEKYGHTWLPEGENRDFIQKRLGNFLKQENIPYLDLYPTFDQQRGKGYPYFSHDGHFNSLGHQIAAEAIAIYLTESKLVE